MKYELTNIEKQVQPDKLWTTFAGYFPGLPEIYHSNYGNTKPVENFILEISPDYFVVLEKFKKSFFNEYYRICTSIREHKTNETEEAFIRYVSINYSGVIRLLKNTHTNTPPEPGEEDMIYDTDFLQNTRNLIYYNLHKLFLLPLKDFIESNFKTELIRYHLLDSPIDSFLAALQNNKVILSKHTDAEIIDYQTIYYPEICQTYLLKYNGFSVEAEYNDFLLEEYNDFHKYVDDSLKETTCIFEKISLLTRLKISISELEDLFHENTKNITRNLFPEFYRSDATDNLKRQLFLHKASTSLNNLFPVLAYLTEVQRMFIVRALKFLKGYIKLYRLSVSKQQQGNSLPGNSTCESFTHYNTNNSTGKLQWRGNINQLITFFYDASSQVMVNGHPVLNATKKQIAKLLIENFIQKDGDPINPATINTIFTPSKEYKRPPLHKRIIFPDT